ncbi:WD40 repeat-like protein [Basidiobolus meristosporus CBS 931.73]|uniref:WD40 repeat-like protein n=1 Tax=Basidiobolus meristosporus CBS 931.73 TaxID=1314790 RepID=A0A1Y1Z017_9FUNG|nr:WD40 repeat-like protein [Basidiobolus meristosporus CBS 931.73]|eukprot:ORY03536.1 WD40 repeat-like protein [Basidiobolus meristosporus CBS 931.73]
MSLEIESTDVIRLIQQFLKENNLPNALKALQDESSVVLNTVENIDAFSKEIEEGRWDSVLKTVGQIRIPQGKLVDLYEQIIIELIEMRELGAARTLLRQTDPMFVLRDKFPDRYLALEQLLSRTFFDPKEAYPGDSSKEKRRQAIAKALSSEVTVVPPSRLLTLLGQAVKWQQHQGLLPPDVSYDLFQGKVPTVQSEEDAVPSKCYNTIKFPKKQHAECVAFSPDGQYMVTGSVDGFIEVWNYLTAKLRKDLKYQAEDKLMLMEDAVLCLAFSRTSDLLASGSQDGKVKIWKVHSGQCIRKFTPAHAQGVTSVCFSKDGSQIITGSFDQTIRLHGLKSGKTLREYRGHSSFVNTVAFSSDMSKIISGSSDGTVKIWDYRTTECLLTVTPTEAPANSTIGGSPTVNSVILVPDSTEQLIMCNKSSAAYLMSTKGRILRKLTDESIRTEFASITLSPKAEILYCVGEDSQLYSFNLESGKLLSTIKLTEAEVIGVVHHPFSNILAVYTDDGKVHLWKP